MSVTTQIFFPYMSDARTPAMDVQMAAQDACMTRSFHVFLSAMLIEDDGSSTKPMKRSSKLFFRFSSSFAILMKRHQVHLFRM
jgi:hypothetical protein